MAHVSGPTPLLPGSTHRVPEGQTCDEHEDRPAVIRVQGETDSFGAEYTDMCQECKDLWAAYRGSEQEAADNTGTCDWCKSTGRLFNRRDYDEGTAGPVYRVCGPCITKDNERGREDRDDSDDRDDGDYDYRP